MISIWGAVFISKDYWEMAYFNNTDKRFHEWFQLTHEKRKKTTDFDLT